MKFFNKYKSQQWQRSFSVVGLVCIIAMSLPMPVLAQPLFIYSEMRNHVTVQIRLGPNAQTAAQQLVDDFNEEIGATVLFLTPQPTAYITFRDQYNIRRHDSLEEGENIGSGHSVGPILALLVRDTGSSIGLSILSLATFSTNPGIFDYLDELGIKAIPLGKTADDLVCQVWRKLEVLNSGDVEKFQQEWHINSDELGEIRFKIKFRRQVPIYTLGHPGGEFSPYLGLRYRSDSNPIRQIYIERRGTLYPLNTSLVRLSFDLNDPLLNEIYGDNENEFVGARQDFLEYYLEEHSSF